MGICWVEIYLFLCLFLWIVSGLLVVIGIGLGVLMFGYLFLMIYIVYLNILLIGELYVVSVLFYDIGVFILVVGLILLILIVLGY